MIYDFLDKENWTGIRGDREFTEALTECLKRGLNTWQEHGEGAKAIRNIVAKLETVLTCGCEDCDGSGEYFTHSDDCTDDNCALNGDEHSCKGEIVKCWCHK